MRSATRYARPTKNSPRTLKLNISTTMAKLKVALEKLDSLDQINYTHVADEYGISRDTLSRHHKRKQKSRADADREYKYLLPQQQELFLVDYINKLTDRGIPPTTSMVRNFTHELAKKRPSKMWVSRFNKRNSKRLSSGYLKGADLNRTKADNWISYRKYFELVSVPKYLILLVLIFKSWMKRSRSMKFFPRIHTTWMRRDFLLAFFRKCTVYLEGIKKSLGNCLVEGNMEVESGFHSSLVFARILLLYLPSAFIPAKLAMFWIHGLKISCQMSMRAFLRARKLVGQMIRSESCGWRKFLTDALSKKQEMGGIFDFLLLMDTQAM